MTSNDIAQKIDKIVFYDAFYKLGSLHENWMTFVLFQQQNRGQVFRASKVRPLNGGLGCWRLYILCFAVDPNVFVLCT